MCTWSWWALPGQLALAREQIESQGLGERTNLHAMDVLAEYAQFSEGGDTIWMRQFLDCFSPENIKKILQRVAQTMATDGRIYILEPFSDRQQFSAASLSLNAPSLCFTSVANGSSHMYSYREFAPLVSVSGLQIESEHHLSFGHSLLTCQAS